MLREYLRGRDGYPHGVCACELTFVLARVVYTYVQDDTKVTHVGVVELYPDPSLFSSYYSQRQKRTPRQNHWPRVSTLFARTFSSREVGEEIGDPT